MVVLCKPEEAMEWYDKMWSYTVELFRSLDIPVRTLECCSGDLADLKVKSCDVEAWSPRQQKYFEVGSCSTLGDAQARRLGIRAKGENGNYYVSTLNNTVLASTRAVIAFIEITIMKMDLLIFLKHYVLIWVVRYYYSKNSHFGDSFYRKVKKDGIIYK